jgi:transmembrane sensor
MEEPTDQSAAAEATRWLIALQEEPTDPYLRARFDAWRAADPGNQAAWNEASHAYDLIGETVPCHARHWRPETAPEPVHHTTSVFHLSGQRGWRKIAAGITVAAAAACLCLFFAPDIALRLRADYVTATAESRVLHLDDGSSVQLAPESAVDIAFSAAERRVHLLQGEAFFEVTPDPARPFRVDSGDVQTTVFGTGFDVRLDENGAEVAVRHGLVRVDYTKSTPPISAQLRAGDWVRMVGDGQMSRGNLPPRQIAAWLGGQLIAQDRPVSEVLDDLRRYYHGLIILTDPSLADRQLTGIYNLADPVQAVEAVARAHGAIMRQVSPWILVVSRS